MRPPTFTRPQILTKEDGNQLLLFDMRPHPRLKPSLVASRRKKMRTYIGQEKGIRGSPWRLNLVCQFVAGLTLNEALLQLQFSKKGKAPLVQKVLKRTSNLADIRDGLQMSQLEVAECFATKGTPLKRLKIMAKGRFGRLEHRFAHFRVVLREIDFPLKIYQARTAAQKKKWFLRQQEAEADYARAAAERAEVQRLERETAQHATTS
jgi:large subunit ribosomal protein L22